MPVRMRKGATSSRTRSISSSCSSSRSRLRPWAIVSRGEWSVTTRYSWPSAIAVRAITSTGAPPSLQVVWLWQSPRSAARSSAPSPIGIAVSASSSARYSSMPPSRARAMTLAVDGPMPGRSCSVPSAWRCGDLVVAELAHEVAGVDVGLDPAALGERSVLQVDDAVEGVGRGHRGIAPTYPPGFAGRRSALPCTAMERFGFVGLPNAGKSSLYNALAGRRRPRRAVRLRHHRPQRRHGPGARPPPRRPGRDEQEQERRAGHRAVRRHRRPGGGGQQGRGAGQQVPQPTSARSTPSCSCCGPSRTTTCRARPTRSSTSASSSSSSPTPTSRRSRTRSRSAARPPRATSRSLDEVAALDEAQGASSRRARRSTASDLEGRRARALLQRLLPAHQPAGDGARQRGRGPARRHRRGRRARCGPSSTARPRSSACACSSRPRPPCSTPTSGPRCSRASGSARARCPSSCTPPTSCSGCAPSSPPARRSRRAWTFRAGYKAPQCAGVIHGDFERGFIRAEVIHWDELLELGSWNKAKDVGKLRVEGKDYVVAGRRRHGDPLQRLSAVAVVRRAVAAA